MTTNFVLQAATMESEGVLKDVVHNLDPFAIFLSFQHSASICTQLLPRQASSSCLLKIDHELRMCHYLSDYRCGDLALYLRPDLAVREQAAANHRHLFQYRYRLERTPSLPSLRSLLPLLGWGTPSRRNLRNEVLEDLSLSP